MSRTSSSYFACQKEHSRIKAEIAAGYLKPWAQIIGKRLGDLYYLDLFSGPGLYDDGGRSTPLLIMDAILEDPWIGSKIHLSFYEDKVNLMNRLRKHIFAHPAFGLLRYTPAFEPVRIDGALATEIGQSTKRGTYSFIDPWGYKDISLDLVDAVSSKWGCDCLFYLSVAGLVRNIADSAKWPKIKQFFGEDAFPRVLKSVKEKSDTESASQVIMESVVKALRERRKYYVVKYLVEFDDRKRESHYLVFLSKDKRGFGIMRDIMIKRSEKDAIGFPLYRYGASRETDNQQLTLGLTILSDRLDSLCAQLRSDFQGCKENVKVLFDRCLERGYLYQSAQIRRALVHMRDRGQTKVFEGKERLREGKIRDKHFVQF